MSLLPRATSPAPSPPSSPLQLLTSWAHVRSLSPSVTILCKLMMVLLPNIRDFGSLLSTPRHHVLQVESISGSTQRMASCPWMSSGTWWEDRGRPSPVEYSTMPPVYVAPSSTGNVSGIVCSPWLIHWVSPPSSLPTVQRTSSGQSWLNSSARITPIPGLPVPMLSSKTQPSQAGS